MVYGSEKKKLLSVVVGGAIGGVWNPLITWWAT